MKPFQRDVFIVLLANLLSKPVWLIVDNLAQNRIGHEAYGLVGALLGLGQWASALADWGLYALVTREMARDTQAYAAVGRTTLALKSLLTMGSFVLFVGLGWSIGYRDKALLWLIIILLYQLALSYLQYFRAFFQGAQRFRIDAIFSAAEKAVVLVLLAIAWNALTGDLYVGILLSAGLLTAGAAGISVWKFYGFPMGRSQLRELWRAFRQMTPFALMGYATAINERLNQVLLERWISAHENGLYWGAYRWFSAAMMYLWIVLPLFFARFAQLGRRRSPELWKTFLWGQVISGLPILAVAGIFIGAPRVFLLLFTKSTEAELIQMSHTLQMLAFPLALNGLTAIYSTYLTAVGYEWQAFWLMVGASGINFVACKFLLPPFGAVGAALALGLSYLFYGAGFVWIFHRVASVPSTLPTLGRITVLATLYGAGMAFMSRHVAIPLLLGIAPILFIIAAWVSGIIRVWKYAVRHR